MAVSVLLIDAKSDRASLLKRALVEYDYHIIAQLHSVENLLSDIEDYAPDVVVVGIDLPDKHTLDALADMHRFKPHPVVMFAEKDTPHIIKKAVQAGISAFIVDDIQPQRLQSIISIAMLRFSENQNLRKELQKTKSKLSERKFLEQAKGLLMRKKGFSEQEAYGSLRKMSMDKGLPLAQVAENVIEVMQLLEAPNKP